MTDDLDLHDRLAGYVQRLFAPEDEVLKELRDEIGRRGLPEIYVSAEVGRLLQVLLSAVHARRVLEIGTLGGYSAIWMARVLPADGYLLTVEIDAERAELSRVFIRQAALEDVIEVRVGNARGVLADLVAGSASPVEPFDAVFIDADKESYVEYLDRALELVRPGGLIIADNAFRDGRVLEEASDDATRGIQRYNERIADHPRLASTVIPVRDGVAVSVVGRRDSGTGRRDSGIGDR